MKRKFRCPVTTKRELVAEVLMGYRIGHVARKYGLSPYTLRRWIREYRKIHSIPPHRSLKTQKNPRHSPEYREFIPPQDRNPTAIQFNVPFGAGPIRSLLTATTAYSAYFALIDATTPG